VDDASGMERKESDQPSNDEDDGKDIKDTPHKMFFKIANTCIYSVYF